MANPKGLEPWLEPGAWCKSRTGERHLIASSTEVYVYRTNGREIHRCLHCHRAKARASMSEVKAARRAGFDRVADYRADLARQEEEAIRAAMVAEAMAAWRARVSEAKTLRDGPV